jgi:Putative Ig domain
MKFTVMALAAVALWLSQTDQLLAFILTIRDGPQNYAPRFITPPVTDAPPPPTAAPVGQQTTYQIEVYDPEGDPISLELSQAPPGMALDSETGVVYWTPTFSQLGGTWTVTISASDPNGGISTLAFDITVTTE